MRCEKLLVNIISVLLTFLVDSGQKKTSHLNSLTSLLVSHARIIPQETLPMACQIPHPTRVSPSSRGRGVVPNPKEPKIENSGIKQGTFVKRHRIPRPSSLGGLAGWQCVMLKICCVWKGWKVRKSRGWSGWGPLRFGQLVCRFVFLLQMHLELNGYKHKEDHNEWHSI